MLLPSFFVYSNRLKYVKYIVEKGDTLISIAKKYNIRVSDIVNWNTIQNKNKLYKGSILKIYQIDNNTNSKSSEKNIYLGKKNTIQFTFPIKQYSIIKKFSIYGDSRNYGLLMKVHSNKTVFAANSGRVIETGYLRGYGNYVLLDHGKGWISMYSHLKSIVVQKGIFIQHNKPIGISSGSRMFFLISRKGLPKNPLLYLDSILG